MKLPAILSLFACTTAVTAGDLRVISPDTSTGSAKAVVAPADAVLVYTHQVMAGDARSVLARLDEALKKNGSTLAAAVRLNFYLAKPEGMGEVQMALAAAFAGEHKPAVTYVTTALPMADAVIGADAVGLGAPASGNGLPAGVRVFISGQAEKGDETLGDAAKQTLLSLERTLAFLGLTKNDVVQVKSFLTPMAKWAEADREVTAFFGAENPARAYVEWESTLPIEIEMVVSGAANPALAQGPAFEIRTPPGMTHSPVYSRLGIVRHSPVIYTGSFFPSDVKAPVELQVRSLFTNLKKVLDAAGSDWSHLAKATYYYHDDAASAAHNLQRPDYFNPKKPPAASKAKVRGVGIMGQGINLDMIAVPAE